jgi:hypothetical protein
MHPLEIATASWTRDTDRAHCIASVVCALTLWVKIHCALIAVNMLLLVLLLQCLLLLLSLLHVLLPCIFCCVC